MSEDTGIDSLKLLRINGFDGTVRGGLLVHPDNNHLVYPLGCNIIIESLTPNVPQCNLSGHSNSVTCIAIDPAGKYIASGQKSHMGFAADIIVWNFETKKMIFKNGLHKVKIEALTFTKDSNFLITLGGRDDGAVVVWHLGKQEALCGSPAQSESAGITRCLVASKEDRDLFVTGGENTLLVWNLDAPNRKIRPTNVKLGGGIKRDIICIKMADDPSRDLKYMFCGTKTGDILAVNLKSFQMQLVLPDKNKFGGFGVTALAITGCHAGNTYDFLVGTGDGMVGRYEVKVSIDKHRVSATFKHHQGVKPWTDPKKERKSAVTSIAKRGSGHMFFVGTEDCQMYRFNYAELTAELIKTCHSDEVTDIVFPFGTSDLVVTSQFQEIRVWNIMTGEELRRYYEANMTCTAIFITRDGRFIYSAWDDGVVRVVGFGKSAKEMKKLFVNRDTHNKGVTAIAVTTDGRKMITGGGEGQVRAWQVSEDPIDIKRSEIKMLANMKEHKGRVTCIQIHPMDQECVSASSDGSTIIWCLQTYTRKQIVLANTLFKCVAYGAKGVQIVTSGTDHKIGYWEARDGSVIRELEGSKAGSVNTLDIATDCKVFVTGGEEKLIKVWKYREGEVTHVGIGHSDEVTKARICPNQKIIVTGGKDGALLVWQFPPELCGL